jgi:pyruvate/2-oxoglutarate dehydrogenase complex dihydrolipoamide acyltransferase (E2) component
MDCAYVKRPNRRLDAYPWRSGRNRGAEGPERGPHRLAGWSPEELGHQRRADAGGRFRPPVSNAGDRRLIRPVASHRTEIGFTMKASPDSGLAAIDAPALTRYRTVALPRSRRVMAALMDVARTRRLIVAFIEADVTKPRQMIREQRRETGESISLTAYAAACLARAISQHPALNAARRGRKLVTFDDVNVVCYLERMHGDEPVVGFVTLRAADRASVRELTMRLRAGQAQGAPPPRALRHLPIAFFRPVVRYLARSPRFLAEAGVIAISNVGSESGGVPGWGFAPSATSVEVTLGGITKRLTLVGGDVCEREHLCLTVSLDHDIVDGAAGARFVRTFVDLVASGSLLDAVPDAATKDA